MGSSTGSRTPAVQIVPVVRSARNDIDWGCPEAPSAEIKVHKRNISATFTGNEDRYFDHLAWRPRVIIDADRRGGFNDGQGAGYDRRSFDIDRLTLVFPIRVPPLKLGFSENVSPTVVHGQVQRIRHKDSVRVLRPLAASRLTCSGEDLPSSSEAAGKSTAEISRRPNCAGRRRSAPTISIGVVPGSPTPKSRSTNVTLPLPLAEMRTGMSITSPGFAV